MRKKCTFEAGLTIIELLVALSLSTFLLMGVFSLFNGVTGTYNLVSGLSQIQENGRFSITFLSQDIRMAGYFGYLDDVSTQVLPSPPTGTETDCLKNWVWRIEEPIFGYDQTQFNPGAPFLSCIPTFQQDSDFLVLRMSASNAIAVGALVAGRDYLHSNFSTGELIRSGTDAPALVGVTDYWEIKGIVYFVKNNNAGVPSLFRYDSTLNNAEE